jgi:hypothetical protein
MKKLSLLLMLIITSYLSAQDVRFAANIYTEPQLYSSDGFNIGVGIEYQMTVTYFDVNAFVYPDLNGFTYSHIQGTILGFNHHTRFQDWRFKLGVIKPGIIRRDGHPHPMIGSDIGIEYYANQFYIGGQVSGDYRTDNKIWGEDKGFYRVSVGVKFGFHW